jgi:simple sugar transport system permease protein
LRRREERTFYIRSWSLQIVEEWWTMNETAPEKKGKRLLLSLLRMRSLNVFFIFLILFVVFTVLSPGHRFTSRENLELVLAFGAEFNIIALAVGMLMISGEFDLSVGSILVFCSFVFLKLFDSGLHVLLAAICTLGIGTLIGLGHGYITVKTGIPSFITTLGAMMFWRGVTLFWSQGFQKPLETVQFPVFTSALTGIVAKVVPVQLLWFIGIMLVMAFIIHFHKFGNWVFATGDNKLAAKAMGINTDRVKMACFAVVGLICSLSAILQIVRVGTFSSRAGDGWELKTIAASVVGGTALTGGIGSMVGVFWGALIISIIENGLVVLRIPYAWTYTVFGVVIVCSVIISNFIEQRRLGLGAPSR